MPPNPQLRQLGFGPDDRVVISHVDDVGLCQAARQAFIDLWDAGTISSGAAMVPRPWLPAAAAGARANPGVDAFISRERRDFLRASSLHIIGYRPLREIMQAALG